ncbi:hypothetical protein [Acidihalobacter prosperus]|uniref:hypothetical protein n=1 Tax=Acidihalobacter prosperus TaxID=160660 RepID=UPI000504F95D|nr:hypothetical protein [Acidihalobacter prosperus]
MSIRAQLAVWDAGRAVDGTLLIAMLALADWADDDGVVIYRRATVSRLAKRIRRGKRQTQRVLSDLASRGWLTITHRPGHRSIYHVRVDLLQTLSGDVMNVAAVAGVTPETWDVTPNPDTGVGGEVTSSVSSHIPLRPNATTTTTPPVSNQGQGGGSGNDDDRQELIFPSILTGPERDGLSSLLCKLPICLHQALLDELAGAVAAGRKIPNRLGWLRATAQRWMTDQPTPELGLKVAAARNSAAEPDLDSKRVRVRELASAIVHFQSLGRPELAGKELDELRMLAPHHPLLTSSTATPGASR